MENIEYNRIILDGKLYILSDVTNMCDLTNYTYLGKTILEHLLEKNIHSRRMDSYAINHKDWILMYIKYDIIEPLLDTNLNNLLLINDNELILETLLKKLDNKQKRTLYLNFKRNNYWSYRMNESIIIYLFGKYNYYIHRVFLELPSLSSRKTKINEEFELLINEFIDSFKDIEKYTLEPYVAELKRIGKINKKMTYNDIYKLIIEKRSNPDFKFILSNLDPEIESNKGEYDSSINRIAIDLYEDGTFTHELSHMLLYRFENNISERNNKRYQKIQDKITDETINKIISYLKEFHQRYDYMDQIFLEIYHAHIRKYFGNLNNYGENIKEDIIVNDINYIEIDNDMPSLYIDEENIDDVVVDLINCEAYKFIRILTNNYYSEELALENFLDALLKGSIHHGDYDVVSYSGHKASYFENMDDASFDECLADFYVIKHSCKSRILINKLREIVGDELVDFFERYVSRNRNNKIKIIKR